MTTEFKSGQTLARGVIESVDDHLLVLEVPGTSYKLHLVPVGPISTPAGQRVTGSIHAQALRVHAAQAGGRFIEPVWGQPRIVQGTVCGTEDNRLLVDVTVPMWVTLGESQDPADFPQGQMVNFYVQSGATFREE